MFDDRSTVGSPSHKQGRVDESGSFRVCDCTSLFFLVCSGEGTQHAPRVAWELLASLPRCGFPLFVMSSLHHYSQTESIQLCSD